MHVITSFFSSMSAHKIGAFLLGELTSWLIVAGSLLFCPRCGTLLDTPKGDDPSVECEQCKHVEPASCMLYPRLIIAY